MRPVSPRILSVASALVLVALASCAETSAGDAPSTVDAANATGSPSDASDASDATLGSCPPSKSADSIYRYSDLPTGACNAIGPCKFFPVFNRCPCPTELVGQNGYVCECISGTWSCKLTSQGMTACLKDAECKKRFVDAATD